MRVHPYLQSKMFLPLGHDEQTNKLSKVPHYTLGSQRELIRTVQWLLNTQG